MGLAILKSSASQRDVEVAWMTYRALILAECDDTSLQSDGAHQFAISNALRTYRRLYDDWSQN
jgi:hypothetical protein